MPENNEGLVVTTEGLNKLKDELDQLKTVRRPEVSEKIKIARGFGDLSENAEYDEAKKEQAEVEQRISELEDILKHAKVVDESSVESGVIGLGSIVQIHDIEFDEKITYKLVSSIETDPDNGKISVESPVGKALIGKKARQKVTIETPGGKVEFKILKVSR